MAAASAPVAAMARGSREEEAADLPGAWRRTRRQQVPEEVAVAGPAVAADVRGVI